MTILEFTMAHMHTTYPIALRYEFIHHSDPDPHVDGLTVFSNSLDDIVLHIYNNRTLELQARTFVHEYHHLTQLERHGADEQIQNRWKYEVETEEFTRDEFEVITDKYSRVQAEVHNG